MKVLCLLILFLVTTISFAQVNMSQDSISYYSRTRDSAEQAYYHKSYVHQLSTINIQKIIPEYITEKDSQTILLVTAEYCAPCELMPEILDSIQQNYPALKILTFTSKPLSRLNRFDTRRYMGALPHLADTLATNGTPRLYFIKNGYAAEYKRGGPNKQIIPRYLKSTGKLIEQVYNLPNAWKHLEIKPMQYESTSYLDYDVELRILTSHFRAEDHTLDTCFHSQPTRICKIDGQDWFGLDYGLALPKTQLDSLIFSLPGYKIALETSGMFNVSKYGACARSWNIVKQGNSYILSAGFSDGAGYYLAKWKIESGLGKRILISNNEDDF